MISCNKNICTLQITDTTGSHQFPAMQRLSISKGHAFILVFSVSSRQSLEELKPIWELIKEIKGPDLSQIPIMLVGNKCDESAELREVSLYLIFIILWFCAPNSNWYLLFYFLLRLKGEYIRRTRTSGELGRELHGNLGQDKPQRQAALPRIVKHGEIAKRESPGGW